MQKIKPDLNLGSNLRRLRMERGITQEALSAKLGVMGIDLSGGTYSRYETGELNVPVSVLVALHTIYRCTYDEFFKGLELPTL